MHEGSNIAGACLVRETRAPDNHQITRTVAKLESSTAINYHAIASPPGRGPANVIPLGFGN